MKPQRSTAALGVMLAVLLVWLVVRSRLPSPSPGPATGNVSSAATNSTPGNAASSRPSPTNIATLQDIPPVPTAAPTAPGLSTPQPTAVPSVTSAVSLPTVTDTTAASPSETASINAIRVRRMITDYHTLTGENPTGTNAEIMAATMGKNPRQATLGPPEGLNLNAKGELVDDWGTPYFFHQLSKDVMEIHSAGPDKVMGTADDVIVR